MVNFDELLSNLHSGGGINLEQEETGDGTFYKDVIWIDDKRNFVLPVDFNPTIAYEGDVNSKIILFELPKEHYGHALEECDNKKLKWKNTNSGAEGTSTLIVLADGQHEGVVYKWEVPAEAFTRSGDIQIAIVFYDEDEQGLTAFSWNTAKFSGLNVGETVNYIGVGSFPAKDEILIINTDTKNITAPSGYNNTICNCGEIGVTEVYFLVNRYIGKNKQIDVLDAANVYIYVTMNGNTGVDFNKNEDDKHISKRLYSAELESRDNEGLVLITWKVPAGITSSAGPGSLSIMVGFEKENIRWFTNIYSQLKVGDSILIGGSAGDTEWNLLTDYVAKVIEDIFDNNFVIDANM